MPVKTKSASGDNLNSMTFTQDSPPPVAGFLIVATRSRSGGRTCLVRSDFGRGLVVHPLCRRHCSNTVIY